MITLAHQEHPELSIVQLCDLLDVSRSWYYERDEQADPEDIALRDEIERIILEFSGYGYRRVTRELVRRGWPVNYKRVLRIMREEALLCQIKKHFVVVTTNSRHGFPVYPNLLSDVTLSAPDQAWVADFTYIRLRSAFVYLAAILDAFSRRCVGWHLSGEMNAQMTSRALQQAIAERCPLPGLIHHSDRGVQYASHEYIEHLQAIGARISMSAVGNPYDNAKEESFFKTMKQEEVYLKEYTSFADAEQNLTTFIEKVYNEKRLHSSLGYIPPAEFEAASLSVAGS
ncbi:MAG: IS3 family transposase [Ktedonobacteraceae bacterium]|nr:IS3 family transposase [Ktedonobacteraceae bacterium]